MFERFFVKKCVLFMYRQVFTSGICERKRLISAQIMAVFIGFFVMLNLSKISCFKEILHQLYALDKQDSWTSLYKLFPYFL